MQSVKRAEPKLLKERGAFGRAQSWDHDFVREGQQSGNIAQPVCVRIPTNLELQHGAAHPGRSSFAYHAKNAHNGLGFVANARLALIVCQTAQTTGIQIESQSQPSAADFETEPAFGWTASDLTAPPA